MTKALSAPVDIEVIRECANDLRPVHPPRRVYCSDACKQIVRLWRLRMLPVKQ